MNLNVIASLSCLAIIPITSFAGLVQVKYETGTAYTTTSLTGFSTDGAMMDGMRVTAYFANGTSEEEVWADQSYSGGGVTGTNWTLNLNGDSFSNPWYLNSTGANIDYLLIEAGPGNSMFDILESSEGTLGSALGHQFSVESLNK